MVKPSPGNGGTKRRRTELIAVVAHHLPDQRSAKPLFEDPTDLDEAEPDSMTAVDYFDDEAVVGHIGAADPGKVAIRQVSARSRHDLQ